MARHRRWNCDDAQHDCCRFTWRNSAASHAAFQARSGSGVGPHFDNCNRYVRVLSGLKLRVVAYRQARLSHSLMPALRLAQMMLCEHGDNKISSRKKRACHEANSFPSQRSKEDQNGPYDITINAGLPQEGASRFCDRCIALESQQFRTFCRCINVASSCTC